MVSDGNMVASPGGGDLGFLLRELLRVPYWGRQLDAGDLGAFFGCLPNYFLPEYKGGQIDS